MYSPEGGGAYPSPIYGQPVELPMRFVGMLIDWVPTLVVLPLGVIPIVGPIIAGLIIGIWYLLRDIKGASLGKMLLKERVVMKDGSVPDQAALIKRNITVAAPALCMAIPLAGYILGPLVAVAALILEVVMLATKGERFGDQIAGTKVIKLPQ